MNTKQFNTIYEQAKSVDVVNHEGFNYAGFFWLNLTEKQIQKMYKLMVYQGAKEEADERGIFVSLNNGSRIYRQ